MGAVWPAEGVHTAGAWAREGHPTRGELSSSYHQLCVCSSLDPECVAAMLGWALRSVPLRTYYEPPSGSQAFTAPSQASKWLKYPQNSSMSSGLRLVAPPESELLSRTVWLCDCMPFIPPALRVCCRRVSVDPETDTVMDKLPDGKPISWHS